MHSDHELSILSQQKICEEIIANLVSDDVEFRNKLVSKNANIFSKLRSKFFPKEQIESYIHNYYLSFKQLGQSMTFVCVLANDTAYEELKSFINFIKCFDSCVKLHVNFLLINWPKPSKNIVNNYDFDAFSSSFIEKINRELLITGREAKITLMNVVLDDQLNIISPSIVANEFKKLSTDSLDETTIQDILWTIDFYQREDSLKNLSDKQTLIDLAIRKSISPFSHANIFNKYDSYMNFLITSELHKRIVKCYRAQCSIFNISLDY